VSSVNLSGTSGRKEGMDVFKSPRPEMTEITNNFLSTKKRVNKRVKAI
jgi:hypothetical protein